MTAMTQAHARYLPGSWSAIMTDAGAALLHPSFSTVHVRTLWDAMAGGRPLSSWLEILAGGGLTSLADFALVERSGTQLRVLARGDVVVVCADQELHGRGMSTWREAVLAAGAFRLEAGSADGGRHLDEDGLPWSVGVVAAESVGIVDTEERSTGGSRSARESLTGAPAETSPAVTEPAQPATPPADAPVATDEPDMAEGGGSEAGHVAIAAEDDPDEVRSTEAGVSESTVHPAVPPKPASGIIDSVPWAVAEVARQGGAPAAQHHAPEPAAEDDLDGAGGNLSEIDDHTVRAPIRGRRSGETPAGAEAAAAIPTGLEGDHDGSTVMVSDLASMRDATIVPGPGDAEDFTGTGPGSAMGTLVLSTGARIVLDRPVLIGRAPESSRFGVNVEPRLVTVPSPEQDISRTHVELRVEGDHLLVTDLNSTNGTLVVVPGGLPRRLHAGEAVPVPIGTLIDLGDGVSGTIEAPEQAQQT
ncbi:FHA domain-containing protein [Ruania halotolerans]|uniref:FHA domain-containing protein n=1 Tax=Ruania halotolerans TaxID=2897773 RepID=UPI001E48DCFB|nr:FHA domain-containing protein [Ruania halotolerans]UFU04930.1 FHA domain-containing protein [Ruania halotolerans]